MKCPNCNRVLRLKVEREYAKYSGKCAECIVKDIGIVSRLAMIADAVGNTIHNK